MTDLVNYVIIGFALSGAIVYIYFYLKRMLTFGEEGKTCASCPLNQPLYRSPR